MGGPSRGAGEGDCKPGGVGVPISLIVTADPISAICRRLLSGGVKNASLQHSSRPITGNHSMSQQPTTNRDFQLQMSRETWKLLQQHGIKPGDALILDFSFEAPDREAADRLVALLRQKSESNLQVEAHSRGLFRKKWIVKGSQAADSIDESMLLQWVEWMVVHGENCRCEFDGWGAMVADGAG